MPTFANASDLSTLTIAGIADAYRTGELSPAELTDAYLARIAELDGRVGAYVEIALDRARADARRATDELAAGHDRGPLHGVPIALKDLIDTAGIPTAYGAAVYRGRVPDADATVAARLARAGAVMLGKTNTHELAFGITTTNPHFGATHNPWALDRVPGGSSGGSGAAMSAALAAGAIGTDTGGSVRIPAALCGCVGLKPTNGLVPKDGVGVMSVMADTVGPLARTVEDAAILLQAMAGYEPSDPVSVPVAIPDYRAALDGDVRGLRIGLPRAAMWGLVDDGVRVATEAALATLADLGAVLVDVTLPDQFASMGLPGQLGFFLIVLCESRFAHREAWTAHPDRFGADLQGIYGLPEATGEMLAESLALVAGYAAAVRSTLAEVDLIAAPTVPVPAPVIGAEVVTVGGVELPFIAAGLANTAPFNMAKVPAISVPCGFADGVPVGLQLAGRPFAETTVLRAAHAYERATEWHLAVPAC